MSKKCPICGKPYRNFLSHIWTHKTKTTKWLAEKRKNKPKSSKKARVSNQEESTKYCPHCGKRL